MLVHRSTAVLGKILSDESNVLEYSFYFDAAEHDRLFLNETYLFWRAANVDFRTLFSTIAVLFCRSAKPELVFEGQRFSDVEICKKENLADEYGSVRQFPRARSPCVVFDFRLRIDPKMARRARPNFFSLSVNRRLFGSNATFPYVYEYALCYWSTSYGGARTTSCIMMRTNRRRSQSSGCRTEISQRPLDHHESELRCREPMRMCKWRCRVEHLSDVCGCQTLAKFLNANQSKTCRQSSASNLTFCYAQLRRTRSIRRHPCMLECARCETAILSNLEYSYSYIYETAANASDERSVLAIGCFRKAWRMRFLELPAIGDAELLSIFGGTLGMPHRERSAFTSKIYV